MKARAISASEGQCESAGNPPWFGASPRISAPPAAIASSPTTASDAIYVGLGGSDLIWRIPLSPQIGVRETLR
jgi:hypothetical protein